MPDGFQPLTQEELAHALQLVGGDAETPEEKDVAWDSIVRSVEWLRGHVEKLQRELRMAVRQEGQAWTEYTDVLDELAQARAREEKLRDHDGPVYMTLLAASLISQPGYERLIALANEGLAALASSSLAATEPEQPR